MQMQRSYVHHWLERVRYVRERYILHGKYFLYHPLRENTANELNLNYASLQQLYSSHLLSKCTYICSGINKHGGTFGGLISVTSIEKSEVAEILFFIHGHLMNESGFIYNDLPVRVGVTKDSYISYGKP